MWAPPWLLSPCDRCGFRIVHYLMSVPLCACLDPHPWSSTPADLVARVESVWEQMEQQAEQQLAGQEQLQQQ